VLWGNNEEKCVSSPGCRRSASRRPQPSAKARRAAARCQYAPRHPERRIGGVRREGLRCCQYSRHRRSNRATNTPLLPTISATRIFYGVSAAEYAFEQIREEWDQFDETSVGMSPLDRLRAEYRALFKYTIALPEFHRFMRQECTTNNPRLKWVAKTVVMPLIDRLLPQIAALQKKGVLPQMEPILFHYMMVSLTAVLSEFGPEMRITSKLAADDPGVVASYWRGVEKMVFGKSPPDANIDAFTPRRSG